MCARKKDEQTSTNEAGFERISTPLLYFFVSKVLL
jgi:hypothetical protein